MQRDDVSLSRRIVWVPASIVINMSFANNAAASRIHVSVLRVWNFSVCWHSFAIRGVLSVKTLTAADRPDIERSKEQSMANTPENVSINPSQVTSAPDQLFSPRDFFACLFTRRPSRRRQPPTGRAAAVGGSAGEPKP